MKAHRSLSRLQVLSHPPHEIASMVASEFLRAADRADYPTVAENCLHRARELMGVLETVPLPADIGRRLRPLYCRCQTRMLLGGAKKNPKRFAQASSELAWEFSEAANRLSR